MEMAVGIGVGIIMLLFLAWRLFSPSLDQIVDRAIEKKDVGSILKVLAHKREKAQPTAFNHVIKRLWDSYQRELAMELIKELVKNYSMTHIAQYWIRQALMVEPQMAKQNFTEHFLQTYYQPEVAAQCGQVG